DIGGVREAKAALRGFAVSLTSPELYGQWGITPPKGLLLYGPPGTGKAKLANALATASGAIFYHLKLMNLTSKFGANTGELLQEILRIAMAEEGKAVFFLDEAEALAAKVHASAEGRAASPVTTEDLLEAIDGYKGVRGVVEKIRYGQYL